MLAELDTGVLRRLPARAGCVDALNLVILQEILQREGIVTRRRRGEYLYREGERLDRVFLMEIGFAAQTRRCRSGKRQVIDFIVPGELIAGQGAGRGRLNHSVEVLADTSLYMMSASSFRRCLKGAVGASEAWQALLSAHLARAYDHLTNMGCRQGQRRLCYILAELQQRLSKAAGNTTNTIAVKQVDLADAAGITTVYVNQIIKKLEAEGLLQISKGSIVITDPADLIEQSGYRRGS